MENIKIRKLFIEDSVMYYIRNNPVDYQLQVQSVKQQKALKKNKYGLVDKSSAWMRWTLRIPTKLFKPIDNVLANPRFLESDLEINWFKKTFPMFKVTEEKI